MSCRLRTEIERDGDEGVRWQLHEQGLTRVGDLVEGLRRHRVQPIRPLGKRTVDGARGQPQLVLYLASSAIDDRVVGWSSYDGTGVTFPTTGDSGEPPYETGLDALKDGWHMIQATQLLPPQPGHEYDVSFLKHEFFFEKLVPKN